jgi:nucleotide-binding universal stress UspA family protein
MPDCVGSKPGGLGKAGSPPLEAIMPYKDILTVITSVEQEQVFRASEIVAKKHGGHLAFVHLTQMPELFVDPLTPTTTAWNELVVSARASANAERKKIQDRLTRLDALTELRPVESVRSLADAAIGEQSLHADITLMQIPDSEISRAAFEGALFKSGRPVLLIPPKWRGEALGENVVIGWKPTREAARAIADAMPFLSGAKKVTVLTVDAAPDGYGQGPGQDIATHLARDGVHVEVRNLDGIGRLAETALIEEARALEADLLVVGGYGHGRLTEFVFGGVTRALSRTSPIPVLVSH